jgi:geranylgeranyl pyrophosphate synthase
MDQVTNSFFDLVKPQLAEVEARMRVSPGDHHPSLIESLDQLLASGGKRIRPTLVLLTSGMLGGEENDAISLAASIEMLHTATLVHDDLIDGSLLRRGLPTLNAQWSPGATVLTGDYIFARAAYLAAEVGEQKLMMIFARTLMTIVNGEISQLFRSGSDDGRKEYFDRIYAKTASLFEVATEGIALVCGCDQATLDAMKGLGYNIGIAFQIVDDVLDFTGKEERVGKPVANDLRQGLVTLPALLYFEQHADREPLFEEIRAGRVEADELEALIASIRASTAIEAAMNEAFEYRSRAETLLETFPETQERAALFDLIRYIADRTE